MGRLGKQTKEVSEKTKTRILKGALKVFASEGFHNTKLRDIAEIAGTTHSLIRYHFGSKDDLWKSVVNSGLQLREDRLKELVESRGSTDPVELFKMLIKSHILFAAQNTELSKILLHNDSRNSHHLEYIIEKQKAVMDIVKPVFKKVQKRGYFKDFDHDSFSIYMRVLTEIPIATLDFTNKLIKGDIRSEKGLAQHTKRVIDFLFHKDS